MSLASKALLVTAKVHTWTGQRLDKAIAADAAHSHEASPDAVAATRILIPSRMLKEVRTAANAIRAAWTECTSPWMNDGTRILPGRMMTRFQEEISTATKDFEKTANDFAEAYEQHLRSGAAKERLGDLFRDSDFPDKVVIRDRFRVEVIYTPVPSAEDWRLEDSLELDRQKELQDDLRDRLKEWETTTKLYWLKRYGSLVKKMCVGLEPKGRLQQSTGRKLAKMANDVHAGRIETTEEIQEASKSVAEQVEMALDSKPGSSLRGSVRFKLMELDAKVQATVTAWEKEHDLD